MNFLFTGVGGASKTLNAIKMIMEDDQLKNRPVFYYNLNGCKIESWTELSKQEAEQWYNLPTGAVILFDEAQEIFRPVPRDRAKSETYTRLEKARHDGFDLILTTQHPMFLDTHARRLMHEHRHFERPFATKHPRMLRWQKVIDDPDDYHSRKDAEVKRVKLDKKYYGLYTSTQFNSHKPRISAKLIGVAFMTLAVIALGVHFFWKKTSEHQELVASSQASTLPEGVLAAPVSKQKEHSFTPKYPMDPTEYLKIFTPRVKGLPSSAPAYDHLTEPTVAPKVHCYAWYRQGARNCKCVTQQMTPVEMSLSQCMNTVDNGMWDPVQRPQSYDSQGRIL